jgi:hypothetical protein
MYEHIGRNSTQAAHIVKAFKRATARLLSMQWRGSGHEIPAHEKDTTGTSKGSRTSSISKKRDFLEASFPSIERVELISHKGVKVRMLLFQQTGVLRVCMIRNSNSRAHTSGFVTFGFIEFVRKSQSGGNVIIAGIIGQLDH